MHDGIILCQATNLLEATLPLPKGIRRYLWDISCDINAGTFQPFARIRSFLLWGNYKIQRMLLGKRNTCFTTFLIGKNITLPDDGPQKTPTVSLNLQPGELVEVKSKEEILATLDNWGKNRGLEFIRGMLKYCGGRYRVLKQLNKRINEETKRMQLITNTVILEGVFCDGVASRRCQRTCYCLWREIWLKRVV